MKNFKKFLYFLGVLAYILGVVGGIACAGYMKSWAVIIPIIVLAAMAFPVAREWFKKLSVDAK